MNTKRILAAIAAITIVFGSVPAQPFADVIGNLSITANAEDIVASGNCGENATYTLDSEGVLTISGTGAIYDSAFNGASDCVFASSIQSIVIEDGITSIGNATFNHCGSLQNITLPDSVTNIGEDVFGGIGDLEITAPCSLKNYNEFVESNDSRITWTHAFAENATKCNCEEIDNDINRVLYAFQKTAEEESVGETNAIIYGRLKEYNNPVWNQLGGEYLGQPTSH